LRIVSSFGLDEKVIAGTVIEMGERVSGWVAQNKKPVLLIDGLKKYPLFAHLSSRQDIGSSVSVPLLVDGKIKGVLNLNRSLPRPGFNNEDLEFVTTLANYLASAIEKDRLYNELVQSEKMGALGYFASGMAHEIRNPLATISAEAQYLIHKALIPESQESLRTIVSESERISDIIERLLSFCRPRERKLGPLEVLRAIDETLKLVSYQMNVANIQVTKDIPANLPEVIASLSELEEVFLNLILNAHQAMSSGGVLVISAFTRRRLSGLN